MDAARFGPCMLAWDPIERLARLRFAAGEAPGDDALRESAGEWLRRRVGSEPFVVLASCESSDAVPLAWRIFWASWFRARPGQVRVACHGLSASERFFLAAANAAFRMDARPFPSEEEALRWLQPRSASAPASATPSGPT